MPAEPSIFLVTSFVLLALVVAAGFVWAVWVAALRVGAEQRARLVLGVVLGVVAWLLFSGGLAAFGFLEFGPLPPPLVLVVALGLAGTIGIAFSRIGRLLVALPWWLLVGYQSFRILVEILLHRAHVEGLAPVQLTWLGSNFDVVTGVSALAVGVVLWRGGSSDRRILVWIWNVVGLALLLNVFITALLSAPTPLQVFASSPPNVWVVHFPFVWLPCVMVTAALLGHLLVFRKLLTRP